VNVSLMHMKFNFDFVPVDPDLLQLGLSPFTVQCGSAE
jgi:hypothetical protein